MLIDLQDMDRIRHLVATLDLIITNEEHMINEILYKPGLGLSDHVSLNFTELLMLCGEV